MLKRLIRDFRRIGDFNRKMQATDDPKRLKKFIRDFRRIGDFNSDNRFCLRIIDHVYQGLSTDRGLQHVNDLWVSPLSLVYQGLSADPTFDKPQQKSGAETLKPSK